MASLFMMQISAIKYVIQLLQIVFAKCYKLVLGTSFWHNSAIVIQLIFVNLSL